MSICPNSKQPGNQLDIRTLKTIVRNLRHNDIRPQRDEHVASAAENARRLDDRIARFVFGRSN